MHICECWIDGESFWREKFHFCLCVNRKRVESLIWVSKHKQTSKQTNKQTDRQTEATWVVLSPDALTVMWLLIQSWTDQLAAYSSCSCSELPYLIHNLLNSNQIHLSHYSFSLVLRLPLISEFYSQSKETGFFSFQLSYLLCLLCFYAYSIIYILSMMMFLF